MKAWTAEVFRRDSLCSRLSCKYEGEISAINIKDEQKKHKRACADQEKRFQRILLNTEENLLTVYHATKTAQGRLVSQGPLSSALDHYP